MQGTPDSNRILTRLAAVALPLSFLAILLLCLPYMPINGVMLEPMLIIAGTMAVLLAADAIALFLAVRHRRRGLAWILALTTTLLAVALCAYVSRTYEYNQRFERLKSHRQASWP